MKLPCATLLALASFAPVQSCGTLAASATGGRRIPLQIDVAEDVANGLAIGTHAAPFPWAASWSDAQPGSSRWQSVLSMRPATRAW